MKPVVKIEVVDEEQGARRARFLCPGCQREKFLWLKPEQSPDGHSWHFTGTVESPTFHPSVLSVEDWPEEEGGRRVCHSWVKAGMVQFLGDSTHELRGQTVPLPVYEGAMEGFVRSENGPELGK